MNTHARYSSALTIDLRDMDLLTLLTNPVVSAVFLLVAIVGLKWELSVPGKVFPLALALVSFTLFLVPLYQVGLAEPLELASLAIALVLMLLEVFVLPGFGVAGVLAIVLGLGGLVLCQVRNDGLYFGEVTVNDWLSAGAVVSAACMLAVAFLVQMSSTLATSKWMKGIAMQHTQKAEKGYVSHSMPDLRGRMAKALTPLRPSGKVEVDGQRYDAISTGPLIEPGQRLVVMGESGGLLRVSVTGDVS